MALEGVLVDLLCARKYMSDISSLIIELTPEHLNI
jgi:hypothetical protein